MARLNQWLGTGLMGLAAGVMPLSAQSLWLPASDPVGIARGGAGVAFGQSLEGAALNPALLVTLRDSSSAFLSLGMEMAGSQITLPSNQRSLFSTDRNRALPAFGAAWRLNDRLAIGLKLDEPFLRHAALPAESSVRFLASSLDLKAQRMEFQTSWAFRPDVSFGVGFGVARLTFGSGVNVRSAVPDVPTQPLSAGNASLALVELEGQQNGSATVPSFSVGFRWAINTRWTFAGAYQSSLSGNLSLAAGQSSRQPVYFANDGFSQPPIGIETKGASLVAQTQFQAGSRRIALPGKVSLGVRQRFSQLFTWEFDMRYVDGAKLQLPSAPVLTTPSGIVSSQALPTGYRSGFGASLMSEMTMTKDWTFRLGMSLDPAL
ncbi:MAG: outer membrane protein transport protein, partial [Holophaga sp.]|nr:outer membrane protein transport protein [Holophaga sp.]